MRSAAPVDTDRMAETRSGSGRSLGSAVTPEGRQAPYCPSALERSVLYSTLIITPTARPMAREDFECGHCGRDKVDCRCFALPKEKRDER